MEQAQSEHKLRKWRKAKGLTLDECAQAIGTTRPVWHNWEMGKRRPGGAYMPLLRDFTQGEVSADDFFPSQDRAA